MLRQWLTRKQSETMRGRAELLLTDRAALWEAHPEGMRAALARHDALLRQAIETHGGHVFKTVGDAFCAAFATATAFTVTKQSAFARMGDASRSR